MVVTCAGFERVGHRDKVLFYQLAHDWVQFDEGLRAIVVLLGVFCYVHVLIP